MRVNIIRLTMVRATGFFSLITNALQIRVQVLSAPKGFYAVEDSLDDQLKHLLPDT
jgi:hypothetical protein